MLLTLPVLGLVCAVAIGLALGTLGGGGSVLTVPVFVYVLGYDPKTAVPASLGVVGAASLMGALRHWRAGRVDLRVALPFSAVAMAGAFAGARVGTRLPGALQLSLLAVVMVIAALLMLRGQPAGVVAISSGSMSRLHHAVHLAPVGAGVGLLTGIVGVGGGFLIVPALVLWGGVPMPAAIGTSLLVITLNCATGLAGYAGRVAVPWASAAVFTGVAIVGTLIGTTLVGTLPPIRLRQCFAMFLLAVGVFVLYRSLARWMGHAL